jgi:hypothetical protein
MGAFNQSAWRELDSMDTTLPGHRVEATISRSPPTTRSAQIKELLIDRLFESGIDSGRHTM